MIWRPHPLEDGRRQRGRSRSDPRRLRTWWRAIGRRRAAPAIPRHHRHHAGARVRPNHRRLEAAANAAAPCQTAAPQQGALERPATHCPGAAPVPTPAADALATPSPPRSRRPARQYEAWCASLGREPLAGDPDTVAMYVVRCADAGSAGHGGLAVSSIRVLMRQAPAHRTRALGLGG